MDRKRQNKLMFLSVVARKSVGWHVQGMMATGHRFPILNQGARACDSWVPRTQESVH